MLGRLVLGLVALLCLAAASPPSPGADEAAALDWLNKAGHPLAQNEPAAAELAPLVARLSGARVIGIGEVTHGTHEDQAFKAALIKQLVVNGSVDMLALEANRAAGRGFDRYVRFGEGDPVGLIRSRSFFRIWKGDEFAGLLVWLRAWNTAHPERMVSVIGIDNQDGGIDADLALRFLAPRDKARAARLRKAFGTLIPAQPETAINPSAWIQASKPGELTAALAAAAELRDVLAAGKVKWGADPAYAEAAYAARIAWQNLHEYELEVGVVDLAKLPLDYLARRDRYMAENLLALLPEGKRAAFWAHDNHVQSRLPVDYTKQGYTSIGAELAAKLGSGYRNVGFTYSRATVLVMRQAGFALDLNKPREDEPLPAINDRPQDVGGLLARLPGNAWWFDAATPASDPAAARWLARPLWRGWLGATYDPDKFQPSFDGDQGQPFNEGFDAIVWFRTMTPQHRWPALPKKDTK